jgi:hypothetical protein
VVYKYQRAYKPEANAAIDVALSNGKLAPDYAIPRPVDYMFKGLNDASVPANLIKKEATGIKIENGVAKINDSDLGKITGVSFNDGKGLSMDLVLTGDNAKDFRALNQAAAQIARQKGDIALAKAFEDANSSFVTIDGIPYTWHHLDNFNPRNGVCSTQLAQQAAHNSVAGVGVSGMAHAGGGKQFNAFHGFGYK